MTRETWRWIEDPPSDGRWNMAVDSALLAACEEGRIPPTLRVYGWERPTLSVGYSQDPGRGVDLERCREQKIPIVRRPTGGRALLHDRELTYSLVVPIPHPWFPSNLRDSFRIVSQALLAGLSCLGVPDARMALGPPVGAARRTRSPSCFASMNHFEIHVRGRKLIGSAQRRKKSAFLQHGSVGITCNRELENSLFRFESPALRQENLEELKNHTLSLQELFGVELSRGTVLRAFKEGFMNSFPARWVPGTLTPEEREKVDSSSIQNSSNERGMILTF